jgi:6-phosphogluconolactonase (cycloisomerase 2 family)
MWTTLALCLLMRGIPTAAQSFIFVETHFDGDAQGALTIDGLSDAFATVVSPSGDHVYVCSGLANASGSDNAIAVFSRAPDGHLTFVEVEFDDGDGGSADGLASCRDVVISPDGKHVYTAGHSDSKIGIFDRDPVTGALTFNSVVEDGIGLDGLGGVEAIAVSPDGQSLFAVGAIDDALVAFSRNATTGALTFDDVAQEGLGEVTGLDRPVDVAVSPDGAHIYTVAGSTENLSGSDAVSVFAWDAADGTLTFVDSYFEGETQGANTLDGLHFVSSVVVSPDGEHVYCTGGVDPLGDRDWIAIFARTGATGELTWLEAIDHFLFCDFDILFSFETYAVLSPAGDRAFITSSADAVTEFARNATTGALTLVDAECLFDDGFFMGFNLPRRLSLDPTGTHFYIAAQADDSVVVFDADGIFADGFESGAVSRWSVSVPVQGPSASGGDRSTDQASRAGAASSILATLDAHHPGGG